jgi:hypothetical protein
MANAHRMLDNLVYRHTHTHSEYIIALTFLQQWLRERASMLRYTYINSLVSTASDQTMLQCLKVVHSNFLPLPSR